MMAWNLKSTASTWTWEEGTDYLTQLIKWQSKCQSTDNKISTLGILLGSLTVQEKVNKTRLVHPFFHEEWI